MGFYLRKSFRMGPVRLNLSKSGLGLSAGVRGVRVGISGSGRTYLHAGRGGLYLRKYLDSPQSARRASGTPTDAVVLYENTGVTYTTSPVSALSSRVEDRLIRRKQPIAIYLLMPLAGLLAIAVSRSGALSSPAEAVVFILGGALLLAWPLPIWRGWRRSRAAAKLGELLARTFDSRTPLEPSQEKRLLEELVNEHITREDREYQSRRAYLRLVIGLVEDRTVKDDELRLLQQAERLLKLPAEFIADARSDAFRDAYLEAIADQELSAQEEHALGHVRQSLSIPAETIQEELDVVERLCELRHIREGNLPTIQPSKPLQKSEICHYETEARMLKEKNLKSFQSEGQRYKVRGLVIDKEGTLLLTNKRLLFVHEGTTSIGFDKILDLEVDYDQGLLRITKDGGRAPVIITTPDVMKAAVVIAAGANL